MIEDTIVKAVTQIANARMKKKYSDLTLKEWQVKEVLEALVILQEELEHVVSKNS